MAEADAASPSPWRQPPFRHYWLARLCTAAGFQMQAVVVGWHVYQLTGAALDLGLVGLFTFLPRLLLTPLAGHAADHYPRRAVALLAQSVQGAAVLGLALLSLSGHDSRQAVFVLAALCGAARTFEMPATQALLPGIVPGALFPRAVAASASAVQAATLAAPAIAGVVLGLGTTTAYVATGLLYVAAALAMSRLRAQAAAPVAHREGFVEAFLAGVRFVRQQRLLLGVMSLDLFAVLLGGATALLPMIADRLLHTGTLGLGLLRSAPAAGALLMSVWLGRHAPRGAVGRQMLIAVAVFGLLTVALAASRWLWLSLLLLLGLGAADMVSVVIRQTMVQLGTPDAMRGRVSALNAIFIGASNQLGEFESGITAAWFGLVPSIALGGLGTLLVVALWWRLFPELTAARGGE
ncbi:MFS transporter [Immundisolibacter sp.]|uniref:MFS transporter n=1 Tax=Immundisolibacter sp. TaxID=1934948 RepID=UPI00262A5E49|nr:MFS transporter [Immundisolibacter sp.]MDD3650676.1 MFS transporter [Immundisolibacter sp.]